MKIKFQMSLWTFCAFLFRSHPSQWLFLALPKHLAGSTFDSITKGDVIVLESVLIVQLEDFSYRILICFELTLRLRAL